MKRLEELALKELDGGLSKSEARELESLLKADQNAREYYHQLSEVEVILRNLDESFDVSENVMAQVEQLAQPGRRQPVNSENLVDRWLPFAIPAGVLAGLALAFVLTAGDHFSIRRKRDRRHLIAVPRQRLRRDRRPLDQSQQTVLTRTGNELFTRMNRNRT